MASSTALARAPVFFALVLCRARKNTMERGSAEIRLRWQSGKQYHTDRALIPRRCQWLYPFIRAGIHVCVPLCVCVCVCVFVSLHLGAPVTVYTSQHMCCGCRFCVCPQWRESRFKRVELAASPIKYLGARKNSPATAQTKRARYTLDSKECCSHC